jgi:hypothetical protein
MEALIFEIGSRVLKNPFRPSFTALYLRSPPLFFILPLNTGDAASTPTGGPQ